MLKRKITSKLSEWKQREGKKSLIIEGARQVGKTFSIDDFAKRNYGIDNYIYINLEFNKTARSIFDGDIDGHKIFDSLSLLYRDKFIDNNRKLLFIDEIQSYPRAITALKALTIDNRLDVIASGSLLGVHYNHVSSFPVGYVERMEMNPLDFEEFLWSQKIKNKEIETLKQCYERGKQVPIVLHNEMMRLFREYVVIGGMPEIITIYNKSKDYNEVLSNQKRIIEDYRSDIAKYTIKKDKVRARECFESIPFQLGKDNKKFQYKNVSKGGRSSIYESSVQWLIDAGIVLKCNNLVVPKIPLNTYRRVDAYKLYLSDIGLLVSMLGSDAQTKILFGDLGISKGAIYENVVGNLLHQLGYDLYYFEKGSKLEIDFIIIKDSMVTGVEVKSADNTQAKSLKSFMENHGGEKAVKLSSKNLYYNQKENRIPLYMIMFL